MENHIRKELIRGAFTVVQKNVRKMNPKIGPEKGKNRRNEGACLVPTWQEEGEGGRGGTFSWPLEQHRVGGGRHTKAYEKPGTRTKKGGETKKRLERQILKLMKMGGGMRNKEGTDTRQKKERAVGAGRGMQSPEGKAPKGEKMGIQEGGGKTRGRASAQGGWHQFAINVGAQFWGT